MKKRVRRRSVNYRKSHAKNSVVAVMMVICFSIFAGYMTATYLIGPALGLESQVTFFEFNKDEDVNKEDEIEGAGKVTVVQDKVEKQTESGYALQYGSFSSYKGAQDCVDDLNDMGIEVKIIEKDGSYKVIGQLFETELEAREFKELQPQMKDVFITEIP